MTVKELIEMLEKCDLNAKVKLESIGSDEVVDVYADYDGSIIITEFAE